MENHWKEKRRKSIHAVLASLKRGGSLYEACRAASIDPASFWGWRKKYPRLDRLVEHIYDSRVQIVEDALFKNCAQGNFAAQAYFLNNRHKLKWKNPDAIKVVQQTVVQSKTEKMTDEQFIEYCRKEGVAIPATIEARIGATSAKEPA